MKKVVVNIGSVVRLVCGLVCGLACGCEEPVFDADIGLAGVPTDPGALAGAFALAATAADVADVPGLGEQVAGGMTFALVERVWDGERYAQTNTVCRVDNFEVAGLKTDVSEQTARSIPAYTVDVTIEHGTGAFSTAKSMELWAIEGIGLDDPVPTGAEDDRVFDMDDDGKIGATLVASGLFEGEIYVAQRKTLAYSGVVRGPDESVGLITHKKEGLVLDATNDFLKQSAERKQHPDPKESWWHEVRVAGPGETADCDAVQTALDDGTLPLLRPF